MGAVYDPSDPSVYEREIREMQERMNDVLRPQPKMPPNLSEIRPPTSPIARMVGIAKSLGLLTHSTTKALPYIRIPGVGWREPEFLDIRGRSFRERLLAAYFEVYGDAPNSEHVSQAIDVIAGIAMNARPNSRTPKKFLSSP